MNSFEWTEKTDGIDVISAADINSIGNQTAKNDGEILQVKAEISVVKTQAEAAKTAADEAKTQAEAATAEIYDVKTQVQAAERLAKIHPLTNVSGSSTAYVAAAEDLAAYADGEIFLFVPHVNSSSGTVTLNVNSLGEMQIARKSAGGATGFANGGFLQKGMSYFLTCYGNSKFVLEETKPYGGTDFYTPVAASKGGTGRSSWVANRLIYPSASATFSQLSFPKRLSRLIQDASGAPTWRAERVFTVGFSADNKTVVAEESGGLTALQAAVASAANGDIILLESGTYGGSGTLSISKNLTFAALGKAVLKFDVTVENGSTFDFDSWEWTVKERFCTCWENVEFSGKVTVKSASAADETVSSKMTARACEFSNSGDLAFGESEFYGCWFSGCGVSCGTYKGYGGGVCEFFGCEFDDARFIGSYETMPKVYGGRVHMMSGNTDFCGGVFEFCDVTCGEITLSSVDSSYATLEFRGCKLFGNNPFAAFSPTFTDCLFFGGSAL